MCDLLESNYICLNTETEVFMAAIRWLSHKWPSRKCHAETVMACVRFGFLPPPMLIEIGLTKMESEICELMALPVVSAISTKIIFDYNKKIKFIIIIYKIRLKNGVS